MTRHDRHTPPALLFDPSRRRLLRCACSGILLLPVLAWAQPLTLPDIGDAGSSFGPTQEAALGEAFFRSIQSRITISHDAEIADYIEGLGRRLTAASDKPGQPFHFFVVMDPTINAFAGPGGYIGVNSGLILASESENELASVLAHEIAHVTQRHIYRSIEAAESLSIPTYAALAAAILLGVAASPELGQAAIAAAQAGAVQYQIDFTREHEQEADRIGIQILAGASFDPRSMPVFFERLQQSSRIYGDGPPEFLRTHPVTANRIAESLDRAEQFPYRQYPDSFSYGLIRAKLRVQTAGKPERALLHFQADQNHGTEEQRLVARYGLALAQLTAGDLTGARANLTRLIAARPNQSHFIHAMAQTEIRSGNLRQALNLYADALKRQPGHRSLSLAYGEAMLRAGNHARAREILLQYRERHTPTPEIYQMLAQCDNKLGDEAASRRWLTEYYYALGDNKTALIHARIGIFKAGQKDFRTRFILEERVRQIEAEEREKKTAKRR